MDAPLSKQPFFQIQGTKGEIVIDGSFEGGMKLVTAEHPVRIFLLRGTTDDDCSIFVAKIFSSVCAYAAV